MSTQQYERYCDKFGLNETMITMVNRAVRGIGGKKKVVGIVLIQVPFSQLTVVRYVLFLPLDEGVSMLMCLIDLYKNGLDI